MASDFSKQISDILKKALKTVSDEKTMEGIGNGLTDRIKVRTRLGKGVKENEGKPERLEKLKDTTKLKRKRLRKKDKLSTKTKPSKSNLTQSGEMVDSITYKAKKAEVVVFTSGKENTRKAEFNEKLGRVFMRISKLDLKWIVKFLDEKVDKTDR